MRLPRCVAASRTQIVILPSHLLGAPLRLRIVPNLIAKSKTERKTFVGDQLDSCGDFSGLQYRLSLEKGYPVNWETQTEVWTRIFGKDVLAVNTADCDLMLSTPPLCPSAIQATIDEMVFEHFNFKSFCTMCPQLLAHYAQQVCARTQ